MSKFSFEETGEMRIYPLYCGGDYTPWAVFDPFDERAGGKTFAPYFIYVVTHPKGNVLFDSGAHPMLRTDAAARIGPAAAAAFEVVMTENDWLVPCLARIGMTPADITHVVQSHLHFDHAGGLEWLTHAKVYVQRAELEFAMNPPPYQREVYIRKDFDHPIEWVLLEGDHDIFGDGLLKIIPTPGHTKGHHSLLVKLAGSTVFLLGDATYLLEKMRARLLPAINWSSDAFMSSWDRVEAIEKEEGAILIVSHELDYKKIVPMAPDRWYA